MKPILIVITAFLLSSCNNELDKIKVKVVFLDGTSDTLFIKSNYYLDKTGTLCDMNNVFVGYTAKANSVKYVVELLNK